MVHQLDRVRRHRRLACQYRHEAQRSDGLHHQHPRRYPWRGGWRLGIQPVWRPGRDRFNLPSLLVAFVGAVIVLAVVNLLFRRK